jgi:hypothetical protein
MASSANQRSAAKYRLEQNNDYVNLIVRRETARVDYWEAQDTLDKKLAGADARYRELVQQLSEIYKTSTKEIPRPAAETVEDEFEAQSSESENEEPPTVQAPQKSERQQKRKHKSARQKQKSRDRLAALKALRKRKASEAPTSPETPEEEVVVDAEEPKATGPKRQKFNKTTGMQIGEAEDLQRDLVALDEKVSSIAVNKKGHKPQ